jgi:hypothetical protein
LSPVSTIEKAFTPVESFSGREGMKKREEKGKKVNKEAKEEEDEHCAKTRTGKKLLTGASVMTHRPFDLLTFLPTELLTY